MCAAEHARPSYRSSYEYCRVFLVIIHTYAHGLGRAAVGTGSEAGRLYLVYARWYFAKKTGARCTQCIMQPTAEAPPFHKSRGVIDLYPS